MPRADFVTGIAFVALGIAALVQSLRMPTFADLGVNPYTVPGLVPGLLGIIIAALGSVLALRAARVGGLRLSLGRADLDRMTAEAGMRRLVLTLVLTIGYAGGLVGTLPFMLATGIFVTLFVLLFTPETVWTTRPHWRVIATAVVLAAMTAIIVALLFERLFLVRLP